MIQNEMYSEISSIYPPNVGIEIKKQADVLSNEMYMLERAKLNTLAPIESWTALGTNSQLAYATHGMFRYFGKFPPTIATYLINRFTKKGDLVIDPMSGSGTTAVESSILERRCIVNDLNPLSYLLAKVKTTFIDEKLLLATKKNIEKNYKPLKQSNYNFKPTALADPDHWFLPETSDSLRGLKHLIEQEKNNLVHDFLQIIFASTVRKVSKATTQQGRLFLDVESAEANALPTFLKKFDIGIKGLQAIPKDPNIQYFNLDVKDLHLNIKEEKSKLIILHPPYFNSYKYSSINCLETGWLGIDRTQYRGKEIKEFFKIGKQENASKYVSDMESVLKSTLPILKKNGILALMIGDTVIKGDYIPVTRMLLDSLDYSTFKIETVAVRVPKYTEAAWVASQRRKTSNVGISLSDFIILIKRIK